jgi:replicative DNA helicase
MSNLKERMEKRLLETAKTKGEKDAILAEAYTNDKWAALTRSIAEQQELENVSLSDFDDAIPETRRRQAREAKGLAKKMWWIDEWFTSDIPLIMDQLYLIGSEAKNGKSTFAANVAYSMVLQERKMLIISNEESEADVLVRVACLHLNLNANDYKKGKLSPADMFNIDATLPFVNKFVKVAGVGGKVNTSNLESVERLMELTLQDPSYELIMIDYFQKILSSHNSQLRYFDILKSFGNYLKGFIKRSEAPVILFAQLHPISKSKERTSLQTRVQHCPDIVQDTTMNIIITKDPASKHTIVEPASGRWADSCETMFLKFDKGKFSRICGEEFDKARTLAPLNLDSEKKETSDEK